MLTKKNYVINIIHMLLKKNESTLMQDLKLST